MFGFVDAFINKEHDKTGGNKAHGKHDAQGDQDIHHALVTEENRENAFTRFNSSFGSDTPAEKLYQTYRDSDRSTDRPTDRPTNRPTDRQAGRQAGRQTDRQTYRQTERQTDRQTDR